MADPAETQDLLDCRCRCRPLEKSVLDHPVVVVELREVGAPAVREEHQHSGLGPKRLRDLDPRPRSRSGRAADEEPLLPGEPASDEERVAVGDAHPLVDHLWVERLRPVLLADPLDQVRPQRVFLVGGEDRALGIDPHDPHRGLSLLEVAADAGDRPSGPDRDDDRVDLTTVRLLPDLRRSRLVVSLRVRGIRVLVGLEPAWDLFGEPVGDRVVALGRARLDGGRGDHDLGPIRAEHRDLLLAHLVRHDEDAAIATKRGGDREADTGVARRGLDDRAARTQLSLPLRGLDHREPDPVLHRTPGVQVLELREQLTRDTSAQALEPDDRSRADELENGRVLAPAHDARRLLRSRTLYSPRAGSASPSPPRTRCAVATRSGDALRARGARTGREMLPRRSGVGVPGSRSTDASVSGAWSGSAYCEASRRRVAQALLSPLGAMYPAGA